MEVPYYLFIGKADSIRRCRKIAMRNALNADFVVATQQTVPDGHLKFPEKLKKGTANFVVYDVTAYSFDAVLTIFERKPQSQVLMGTFFPQQSVVITEQEIIK